MENSELGRSQQRNEAKEKSFIERASDYLMDLFRKYKRGILMFFSATALFFLFKRGFYDRIVPWSDILPKI